VDNSAPHSTQGEIVASDATSDPQPSGGLPITIEEGQNVQGEGGVGSIMSAAESIGRTVAELLDSGTGPAPSPRDRMKEELNRTRHNLKQLEHEYRRSKTEAQHLNRACIELDHENRRHKDTIQSLQHELTNMGRELQEYKTLSDIRGKELIGSQVFLTKADLVSISDLKDMVNTLNDEIFQASASLADSLIHHKYGLNPEEFDTAFAGVCRTLGDFLARVLVKETKKSEPEINPLLVQVVLEVILVHFCSAKIQSWFPDSGETHDFLTSIYSEIRRTGQHFPFLVNSH